jgi:hypothetical protein
MDPPETESARAAFLATAIALRGRAGTGDSALSSGARYPFALHFAWRAPRAAPDGAPFQGPSALLVRASTQVS